MASASAAGAAAPAAPKPKTDFSTLWGDDASADVTIRIKTTEAVALAQQEQEAQQQAESKPRPSKRRKRTRKGSTAAADEAAAAAQQEQAEPGVVGTLRAHEQVLTDRSGYFEAMLLGAGATMVEGRSKSVTVELEDAQGARLGRMVWIDRLAQTFDRSTRLTDRFPPHTPPPHTFITQRRRTSSGSSASPICPPTPRSPMTASP